MLSIKYHLHSFLKNASFVSITEQPANNLKLCVFGVKSKSLMYIV